MIQVSFYEGDAVVFRVEGHSSLAEAGKDIVCAAASILTYTLAQVVADMDEDGAFADMPDIHLNSGDALIEVTPTEAFRGEALHLFLIIQTGFLLLQDSYPEYVSVINLLGKPISA